LRTDQIADFAAAYGVTTAHLTRALGLLDDEHDTLRARAVEAIGPTWAEQMPEMADAMATEAAKLSPAAQDQLLAAVEAHRRGVPCESARD
jgi:hypothetical protein